MCEFVCVQNLLCTLMRSTVCCIRMQRRFKYFFMSTDAFFLRFFVEFLFVLSIFTFDFHAQPIYGQLNWIHWTMWGIFLAIPLQQRKQNKNHYNVSVWRCKRAKDNIFRLTAFRCQSNCTRWRNGVFFLFSSPIQIVIRLEKCQAVQVQGFDGTHALCAIFQCLVRSLFSRIFALTAFSWSKWKIGDGRRFVFLLFFLFGMLIDLSHYFDHRRAAFNYTANEINCFL